MMFEVVGANLGVLIVLIIFWTRLAKKLGIVIVPGLKISVYVKFLTEGMHAIMDLYKRLKHSYKEGEMSINVITCILIPYIFNH